MREFSHSRIISYETCPLRYKYAYIDKIDLEKEETAEMYLGSRVHEALERLYRNLQFGRLISKKELLVFFKRQWQKNWTDSIILVIEDSTQENYRKMGERYLTDYYKRYQPFKEGRIIDLEITDSFSLDEEGRYRFFIRIDRLMEVGNGVYEVHDYKTYKKLPTQEDLDKDRQLAMYSLWVKREFEDCREVRMVWHFLAFDKEMDSYRTEEELEDLRKKNLIKIKEIESANEFPANVSRLCKWCLYKELCPIGKHSNFFS